MKVFVFSGVDIIGERDSTVVGIIEGESREEIIEQFKKIYLKEGRIFEDCPEVGEAEIKLADDFRKWLIFI